MMNCFIPLSSCEGGQDFFGLGLRKVALRIDNKLTIIKYLNQSFLVLINNQLTNTYCASLKISLLMSNI